MPLSTPTAQILELPSHDLTNAWVKSTTDLADFEISPMKQTNFFDRRKLKGRN